mgnify:FL=1
MGRQVTVTLIGNARSLERAFSRGVTSGGAFGRMMSRGLVAASAAFGAAVGGSVKVAADFEKRMGAVAAVSGAAAPQMAKLEKAALRLGATSTFSALQVADAQLALAKAGLSTQQIMGGGLKSALTLATIGGLKLGDAAEYTANAMTMFGLRGKDAQRIAAAFATAADVTTADVQDFGAALVQSGNSAKSAGLSYTETMIALTALAAQGVKGSDAGTSLKTSLIQLIKPTKLQADAAKKAGMAFLDATGRMKPMAEISRMLRDRTKDMTAAQRTALFATLAGTDGVRTLLALYQAGPKQLDRYGKKLNDTGAVNQKLAKLQDNLTSKLQILRNAVTTIGIVLGTALIPVLTNAAQRMADWLNRAQEAGTIDRIAEAVSRFGRALASTVGFLIDHAGTIGDLAAGVATFAAILGPVIVATKVWAAATALLNAAMLANPVVLVVAAIALLVAAFVVVYRRSETVRAAVNAIGNTLRGAFTTAVRTATQLWRRFGDDLIAVARAALRVLSVVFAPMLNIILGVFKAVTSAIRGDWSGVMSGLAMIATAGMRAVVGAIRAVVGLALSAAGAVGKAIVNGIRERGLSGLASLGAMLISRIGSALAATASAAFGWAVGVGAKIVAGVVSGLGGLYDAIKRKAQSAISSALRSLNPFSPVEHGGELYIGEPIVRGAAKALERGKSKIQRALTQTVRDAVRDARGNLSSLTGDLAATVGQAIDARTARRSGALDGSDEAVRLRAIQAQLDAESTARDKARLEQAITDAETDADRADAEQALATWLLEQEARALQDSLDQRRAAIEQQGELERNQTEASLRELTDRLNRGLISYQDFTNQVNGITGPMGTLIGDTLGESIQRGFADAFAAILAQAEALTSDPRWGKVSGTPSVLSPAGVEQREWEDRKRQLQERVTEAKRKLKDAETAKAKAKAQEALDAAQKAMTRHMQLKPRRAAIGALVTRPTLMMAGEKGDELILPLRNRERSRSLIEQARAMLGGPGGGPGTSIVMNIYPTGAAADDPRALMAAASWQLRSVTA